jgi:hypothetical protein
VTLEYPNLLSNGIKSKHGIKTVKAEKREKIVAGGGFYGGVENLGNNRSAQDHMPLDPQEAAL